MGSLTSGRLLSIDPGLRNCAYVLFDLSTYAVIEYGTWDLGGRSASAIQLCGELMRHVTEMRADRVVVEAQMPSNAKCYLLFGCLMGLVERERLVVVHPGQVKAHFQMGHLGHEANKRRAVLEANRRGFASTSDHECDAYLQAEFAFSKGLVH